MRTILTNATLLELDPPRVAAGSLNIVDGKLAAPDSAEPPGPAEVIDCGGAVVMPGFVNGHTHLYSALAAGMPAPPVAPRNFHEILKYVWWRLDRALDAESVEMSARIGALDAVRCGTTTLIDHHASPEAIESSLDLVERGLAASRVRGVLCYEATDRNGRAGREAGLAENRRYLAKCRSAKGGRYAALAGAHASFTLEDETMAALAAMAREFGTGVHIHVAEDPCDEEITLAEHGVTLAERFERFGLFAADCIFGHGTHFSASGMREASRAGVRLAHNPRSNMNNAVGYAPVGRYRGEILLGTDGIGADMWNEARTAWFKSRDGAAGIGPGDVLGMLAASARRASKALGVTLGKLAPGAEADLVVTDYIPATPLSAENAAGHLLFAMGPQHVKSVMIGGEWAMRDRQITTQNEAEVRAESRRLTAALWERMRKLK